MDVEATVKAALAAGDHRKAATEVIRGYGPRVLGYLHRILRNAQDADDAFSLFAEQVWRGMPQFQGRSSVKTWAFKAAWSAAMRLRDDAWRRLHQRLPTSEATRIADSVRTHTVIRVERQHQELEALRATLSEEDQTLLVLRLDQRLSWDDVAEVLAQEGPPVDPAALRKRYERIKERLAKLIAKRRAAEGEEP